LSARRNSGDGGDEPAEAAGKNAEKEIDESSSQKKIKAELLVFLVGNSN
jgi:hypothetical protein